MNSNQFKALLDKQESEVVRQSSDDVDFLNKTTQLTDNDNDNEDSGCSYLDQEAKIPFRKLKQVRLDFLYSFQSDYEVRRSTYLLDESENQGSNPHRGNVAVHRKMPN